MVRQPQVINDHNKLIYTEAVVAKLSLPHYLNTSTKGLSFKVVPFQQNMIPVTGWANTDLRI